jgi:hypothetical protein
LDRLEQWRDACTDLNVVVEVDGPSPLHPATRVVLGDWHYTVALLSRNASPPN